MERGNIENKEEEPRTNQKEAEGGRKWTVYIYKKSKTTQLKSNKKQLYNPF